MEPNDIMPFDDRDPSEALQEFDRMLNDPEQRTEYLQFLDRTNQTKELKN